MSSRKERFIVLHHYRDGVTLYQIEVDIPEGKEIDWVEGECQQERLVEALEINFEPHRGETLELLPVEQKDWTAVDYSVFKPDSMR